MNYLYMTLDKINRHVNIIKNKYPLDVIPLKLKKKLSFNDEQALYILNNIDKKIYEKDLKKLYDLSHLNRINKHYDYVVIINEHKKAFLEFFILSLSLFLISVFSCIFNLIEYDNYNNTSMHYVYLFLIVFCGSWPVLTFLYYRKILSLKNNLSKDNIGIVNLIINKGKQYYLKPMRGRLRSDFPLGVVYYGVDQNGKKRKLIYPKKVKNTMFNVDTSVKFKVINDVIIH